MSVPLCQLTSLTWSLSHTSYVAAFHTQLVINWKRSKTIWCKTSLWKVSEELLQHCDFDNCIHRKAEWEQRNRLLLCIRLLTCNVVWQNLVLLFVNESSSMILIDFELYTNLCALTGRKFDVVYCVINRRAQETVDVMSNETPQFIPPFLWPYNSPDLNLRDYGIWQVMQDRV